MDKERWAQIEKIFYAAMALPTDERKRFVSEACGHDEELQREVLALLAANRQTESFLVAPAALPIASSPMRAKYCPKCSQTYPTSSRLCESDGEVLSLKDPYHLVGQTVMDKYKIIALAGLGGMGAVYCAYHLGIDRRVAFKILQPNVAIGNDYVVELFEREAKLAGRLAHENIVDVRDAGHTPDGIAYIVMEWLEGRTLDEELQGKGPFEFKRAVGIVHQITAALSEAHAKHVVHRDLKPGNIMLLDTPDGRDHVKVLDFGIGKIIAESTANSSVSALVGTPQYASPEQLTMGSHVDGRSDIYSLGVIFYRLLGGQLPFNCASMGELLQMQLSAPPPPLSRIRPGTPPALEALVNSMLAKQPAERPQNAGQVLKLLEQISGALETEPAEESDAETVVRATAVAGAQAGDGDERSTELIVENLPPQSGPRAHQSVQPATERHNQTEDITSPLSSALRNRRSLLYAMAVLAVLLAGGYAFYRARFAQTLSAVPAGGEQTQDGAAASPSPAQINATLQPTSTASAAATPPQSASAPARTETRPVPTEIERRAAPTPDRARQMQANRQKALEHFARAQTLYQQGDYESALRECNQSLQLDPQLLRARQLKQKINNIRRILQRR